MTDKLESEHAPQIVQTNQAAARGSPTEAQFRRSVEEALPRFAEQAGAAMIPPNRIEDLGSETLIVRRAIRALYPALHNSKDPLVQALFEQWQVSFGEVTAHGGGAEQLRGNAEFRRFAKGMGLRRGK